jgi:two-component system, NtrC family, response regulator
MGTGTRKLLVVEDDPGLQNQLRWAFDGYEVMTVGDRQAALEQIRTYQPPVVTLDLGLPPDADGASEGFATLQDILRAAPHTKVIVVTGNADRENALRAVSMGAYDFFNKPINAELLSFLVNRAYRMHELESENRQLQQSRQHSPLEGVVASSKAMLEVCQTVEKVAPTNATVLLLGESGTGKELCARALHELSPRAKKRFVAINCAAIPHNLLESELFGYERGAFTGANKQTLGKIECADGGTLFLDEIGDLPLSLQAKLLRFLQERVIERIGGREEIPIDLRVVCATHQDLPAKIRSGEFREDLYYRMAEINVRIPPLRERESDTLLLARTILDQMNLEQGKSLKGFTDDALAALEAHSWPGNVRELKNRLKRAIIMTNGNRITPQDLELETPQSDAPTFNLREIREQAERQTVLRALTHADGKITRAADLLGISRPTMYDLIHKFNVKL